MMGSIGPSSEKIVYFHYTKHAVARWPQHLSLVLLLLSDTCFKKESDLWRVCISDGLTRMCTSWWRSSIMTSTNHHLWGMSLKQDLMGSMTPKMIQRQGCGITTPRIGLSYIPFQPVKISGWCKEKHSLTRYITMQEANDDGSDHATSS